MKQTIKTAHKSITSAADALEGASQHAGPDLSSELADVAEELLKLEERVKAIYGGLCLAEPEPDEVDRLTALLPFGEVA